MINQHQEKIFETASRILTVVAKISYFNLASLDKN